VFAVDAESELRRQRTDVAAGRHAPKLSRDKSDFCFRWYAGGHRFGLPVRRYPRFWTVHSAAASIFGRACSSVGQKWRDNRQCSQDSQMTQLTAAVGYRCWESKVGFTEEWYPAEVYNRGWWSAMVKKASAAVAANSLTRGFHQYVRIPQHTAPQFRRHVAGISGHVTPQGFSCRKLLRYRNVARHVCRTENAPRYATSCIAESYVYWWKLYARACKH